MSRYDDTGDYYDQDFPGQSALWHANAERALRGKRGRKVLTDLREALMALPEHRLIEGAMCTTAAARRLEDLPDRGWSREEFTGIAEKEGEGVCAVGAYLWHRHVKAGMDPVAAFDALPTIFGGDGIEDTARIAEAAGVVYSLAWNLAYRNDETYGEKMPEARWAAFIEWIDQQLDGTWIDQRIADARA
jgi:hypothetical protein